MSTPRRRLTIAMVAVALLGLSAVGLVRAGYAVVPVSSAAVVGAHSSTPVDPTDLVVSLAGSELRASSDPRHLGDAPWLLALAVGLLALLFGLVSPTGAEVTVVRRRRPGERPLRGPPVVRRACSG